MDLATGGAICNEALKFVTKKKEQIDTLNKLDEKIEEMEEEEEEKITNGIF